MVQRQRSAGLPRKAAGTLLRAVATVVKTRTDTAGHRRLPPRGLSPTLAAVVVRVVGTSPALTTLILVRAVRALSSSDTTRDLPDGRSSVHRPRNGGSHRS